MRRRFLALAATGAASLALVAAGCGGDDEDGGDATSQTRSSGQSAGNGAETGAAELRAGLTGLLTDHVYLAGVAINTGVGAGLDSKGFKAAAGTLDDNSVALSKAIGSVYGDAAGKQFLALWRKHIGFFVDYTKAKATGRKGAAAKAKRELDGYRRDFGAFIASANPNLPADAVARELKPHVRSLFAVIDAAVKKSPKMFDRLRAAAGHMPMTAKVLAAGIVKQYPDKFRSA